MSTHTIITGKSPEDLDKRLYSVELLLSQQHELLVKVSTSVAEITTVIQNQSVMSGRQDRLENDINKTNDSVRENKKMSIKTDSELASYKNKGLGAFSIIVLLWGLFCYGFKDIYDVRKETQSNIQELRIKMALMERNVELISKSSKSELQSLK